MTADDPEYDTPAWHLMIARLHMSEGPCGCRSCNLERSGKLAGVREPKPVQTQLALFGEA